MPPLPESKEPEMSRLSDRMLWHSIDATTAPTRRRRYRKSRLPTVAIWTAVTLLIVGWVILK